jgi:hypothetical protein
MGNTPSQQPFESDRQEGTESVANASLPARVVRSVRSFFASLRQRVLGGSPSAKGPADEAGGPAPALVADDSKPAPPATPETSTERDFADVPARETPFTQPAEGADDNGPDLQATESGDRLAIYYPNCPGATIESDTWERVER